ncbi:MAG: DNA/RNA nuclease SfsA [bacterium]
MKFPAPLTEGVLVRRYKRFLVDVELGPDEIITAHTPNTGAMKGCSEPGSRVWLSRSDNPKRKYPYTLELVETLEGVMVGVHTLRSNALAEEAIRVGMLSLPAIDSIRREVRYGEQRSRIDLLLQYAEGRRAYVEVKNVTLVRGRQALFPDAVTARGTKHLQELQHVVRKGDEAILFFCVQRPDADSVAAASDIDPEYAQALSMARDAGVQVVACQFLVTPESIEPSRLLPIVIE